MTSSSDDTLLQAARQGDQRAFEALVQRYEAQVRGIVGGMVGPNAEVDDIAQEVFIRFYRALGNFEGESQLGTYLGRIAINTTLTALEKQKRNRWLPWPAADASAYQDRADNSQDPERGDLRDSLRQALSQLSSEYRAVVVLRLVEGFSVRETADMLGIPIGTVASRLARAQRQLQQWLAPLLP